MKRFERAQAGRISDVLLVPNVSAGEAEDALRSGGFVPRGEQPCEDSDDDEASINPPPSASAGGGGNQYSSGYQGLPMKLWSHDKDTGSGVGFVCRYDVTKNVLYAKLRLQGAVAGERSLKGAITSLFDVAEACASRRITIGLSPEHASNPEFVCSLLYLGFQVVPLRKFPLADIALMLEFVLGLPAAGTSGLSSDHTHTATSDCSTSAEDDGEESEGLPESD